MKVASKCNPNPDADEVWFKGYISLNQVPGYLKSYHPTIAVSYPTIRQAVEDKALVVLEIGNSMRVTRDSLESFVKQVEEGHYCPSSNPDIAHWRLTSHPDFPDNCKTNHGDKDDK